MTHEMHLHPGPFAKIADGKKQVESRLLDEKRQTMKVGDTIRFTNRADGGVVLATIADLVVRPRFEDLFRELGPENMGHQVVEDYEKLYEHFSEEDEKALGVLGIVLENVRPE